MNSWHLPWIVYCASKTANCNESSGNWGYTGVLTKFSLFIGMRYSGSRRRARLVSFISGISITGLTLGVGMLLTVLSVMNGFDRELRERILGVMPHGAIYQRYGVEDWRQLQQQILAHGAVSDAAPFVEVRAMLSHGNRVAPAGLFGINPDEEARISIVEEFLPAGTLSQLATGEGDAVILLGAGVAEKLRVSTGEVVTAMVPSEGGSARAPKVASFRLLGVIRSGTELDHTLALTGLQAASMLSRYPQGVSGMRLKVNDLMAADEIVREVVYTLGPGYFGSDWTRTHGNLYHAIRVSRNLVGLLLFLLVAIATFNVVSTLVMVVVDKQSDIAVLKTLGASGAEVSGIFLVQGCVIGILGTFLGVALGIAGSLLAGDIFVCLQSLTGVSLLDSSIYPVSYLPTELRWSDILLVVVVSLALSALASVYPAWRASRVAPAEVLRFE